MKVFIIIFLAAALTAAAQQMPTTTDEARAWMIQHFQIPADAQITNFAASVNPITGALGAYIIWRTETEPHLHVRAYDFGKQIVTDQTN